MTVWGFLAGDVAGDPTVRSGNPTGKDGDSSSKWGKGMVIISA
jgi:hypothetical protein